MLPLLLNPAIPRGEKVCVFVSLCVCISWGVLSCLVPPKCVCVCLARHSQAHKHTLVMVKQMLLLNKGI